MNRVTITLTIDLPDGVVPDVAYGSDEPPHLLEAPPYDRDEVVHSTLPAPTSPRCQLHGEMHRYPAGVSKKTGKPFNASWRCDANGCTTAPLWDRDAA